MKNFSLSHTRPAPSGVLRGVLGTLLVLGVAGAWLGTASAQVAGASTTVTANTTESTQIAMGWSVKKTLLGKTIYNEAGARIGRVEDLIISPDRSVSYVIVGAGGFVGIGRHDVAVPVAQIQNQSGKLVLPGVSKETIKAMPTFEYADDSARRDHFVAAAEQDIVLGKAKVTEWEKKSAASASDARAKIDARVSALRLDVKASEEKLGELKQAGKARWHDFEANVAAATARMRKSMSEA